jgi:ketosteroid isomerase-like protein
MSQENVEALQRGVEAFNRRDVDTLLAELDPDVDWYDVFQVMLGGEAAVFRGEEGVRELFRDFDESFAELHLEFWEIRDLGDRIVAIGDIRMLGRQSGAQIESPIGSIIQFKKGKAIRIRSYLDVQETLEAAGLRE